MKSTLREEIIWRIKNPQQAGEKESQNKRGKDASYYLQINISKVKY